MELAQKGLDYDRVRAKLEAARDELASGCRAAQREEFRTSSRRPLAEREGIAFEQARLSASRRGA